METSSLESRTLADASSPARGRAGLGGNAGERGLALLLLLLSAPLLLVLATFILLADGWPAFYRGTRLGYRRRLFTMYKLRTLQRDAEQVLGAELLDHAHGLVLRGGTFLRDTRLDELPQLWNVLRGDMAFLGPRPERPEVYRKQCAAIPGYARRFDVRPGLIGTSQLFTPHGTAKRYRTLIDNGALRRGGARSGLRTVAFTIWTVLARALQRVQRKLRDLCRRNPLAGRHERRLLRRSAPEGALGFFSCGARPQVTRVLDMSANTLRVECLDETDAFPVDEFRLGIPIDRGTERPVWHGAQCTGQLMTRRATSRGVELVIRFQPATPRSEYMIHQYFLRTSLATRHAPWRPGTSAPIPSGALAALQYGSPSKRRAQRTDRVAAEARSPEPASSASADLHRDRAARIRSRRRRRRRAPTRAPSAPCRTRG